jgi:hypothetical protein
MSHALSIMVRPITALAVTAVLAALPAVVHAQAFDHLTCSKVSDSAQATTYSVIVTSERGSQTCTVRTPAKLGCLETSKGSVTPAPPGGGPAVPRANFFMCYRARCDALGAASSNVEDQFGSRLVTFRGAQLLCAPATVGELAPGSGVTTTTTFPFECRFQNGECQGMCSGAGRCVSIPDTLGCECRATPCGAAAGPQCNGFCADAGDTCVFDVTGCVCSRIRPR